MGRLLVLVALASGLSACTFLGDATRSVQTTAAEEDDSDNHRSPLDALTEKRVTPGLLPERGGLVIVFADPPEDLDISVAPLPGSVEEGFDFAEVHWLDERRYARFDLHPGRYVVHVSRSYDTVARRYVKIGEGSITTIAIP